MMTVHKVGALDVAAYANYLTSSKDEERQHVARAGTGRGDYYLGRESQTSEPLGAWWGKGAEELGLAGREVDRGEMVRAWEGKDPSTGEILVRRGGNGEHVAAVDCTVSAPKSVSVVWALSDDEAHRARSRPP
jgi:conjugative relaxase-like TrwC/TraI family protein